MNLHLYMQKSPFRLLPEYLLVLLICYFIFFLRLGHFQLRAWDESMYAVNAYEMLRSGNWIVPLNGGQIDYLNSKPLLSIWTQALCIKFFGLSVLSIRLPSAISACLVAFTLFRILRNRFSSAFAWSSFLVLVTSSGFVTFHTARTGDTDSMLSMFVFLACMEFYFYFDSNEKKGKHLLLFFLFLTCAASTKSISAFFIVPGCALLAFMERSVIDLLKRKELYIGLFGFLLFLSVQLFWREKYQHGYLSSWIQSDVLRYTHVVSEFGHQPIGFYLSQFFYERFSVWILFFIPGCFLLFAEPSASLNRFGMHCIVIATTVFLVLSFASTKYPWYDMQLYPFLAVPVGYCIARLLDFVPVAMNSTRNRTFLMFSVFCIPVYFAILRSEKNEISNGERREERLYDFLDRMVRNNEAPAKLMVLHSGFASPVLFYKYVAEESGKDIQLIQTYTAPVVGDQIVCSENDWKNIQTMACTTNLIKTYHELVWFQVTALKHE